jgi:hypothetical protein
VLIRRYNFLFFFVLLTSSTLISQERITNYDVDITVKQDATLAIRETITVYSERKEIVRGIIRAIPNRYSGFLGTNYYAPILVQSTSLDGVVQPYELKHLSNGIEVMIRDAQKVLSVGVHVFVIEYVVFWQIAHFKDQAHGLLSKLTPDAQVPYVAHDELEWNIIGTGWNFPIEHARVRIQMPEKIAKDDVRFMTWRGLFGSRNTAGITMAINDNGTITGQTTVPLLPHHGWTMVVGWPAGYVERPAWWDSLAHFITDNPFFLCMCLAFLLIVSLTIAALMSIRRSNRPGIIIPFYYPPSDVSASLARFIIKGRCDEKCLAALIVQWAINGLLTIEYKPTLFGKGYYAFKKIAEMTDKVPTIEQRVFERLFHSGPEVVIDGNWQARDAVVDSHALLSRFYEKNYASRYFDDNEFWVTLIFFVSCISVLSIGLCMSFSGSETWFVLFIAVLIVLNIIINKCSQSYSTLGRTLADQLNGFHLFLTTTELERFRLIGTPPTKTPELYEKYLPYAIALDAEEQWSYQFAPIFAQYVQSGRSYEPAWFAGAQWSLIHANMLGKNMAHIFHSAIKQSVNSVPTPASRAPGSGSGFGGRGHSGSGGGGGGGRGC